MKTIFTTTLFMFITAFLCAQAPQGIPYQAVMRNADGSVMASSAVSLTFMIHDGAANGTVVYQESHSLTSNVQGLVSCVVGSGVVSQGNFANINWGGGAKFLHVMMGSTDLGTQQMLSVPYSLYSETTNVSVSATGDTLTIGGNSVIVPGISAANPPALYTMGSGVTDIDGNFYPSIIINGQEWMQKNLAVSKYRNGDPIPTGLSNTSWQGTTSGAYAIYDNVAANNTTYGKLYNWYAVNDSRGLCPTGWHVPSDVEWTTLINYLDPNQNPSAYGSQSSVAGGKMKSTTEWTSPNLGATNESGFSGLPGGARNYDGTYSTVGDYGLWWSSSTEVDYNAPMERELYNSESSVHRYYAGFIQFGFSVRCINGTETSSIQGCTDGSACNFMANATQDNGSCLYQNTTCNDGNANTMNDVIDGNCTCSGVLMVNGCTNVQACNYNPAANVDNGSCLYPNATCDDGIANTMNDVIDANCQCAGTLSLSIGQDYQGGKVAYIFQPGDVGYVAGETHGLIAAAQDLPGNYPWGCYGTDISGADGQVIGTGAQNTLDIVNAGCGGAAQACADLVLNGYSDWFLPSINELQQLYTNRAAIGGFQSSWYWSSSEYYSYNAWEFYFGSGYPTSGYAYGKDYYHYVRAVRAF